MSTRDNRSRNTGVLWSVLAVLVLLALGAGVYWIRDGFERKQIDVPLPPRGEAAYNPLYALKLSLQADGVRVNSRRRLGADPLAARDTLVMPGDTGAMSMRDVQRLVAWVNGGGHLLIEAPSARKLDLVQSGGPLLDQLGVRVKKVESGCVDIREPGVANKPVTRDAFEDILDPDESADEGADESMQNGDGDDRDGRERSVNRADRLSLCGAVRIVADEDRQVSAHLHDDQNEADYYLRLAQGKGTVDVLIDLNILKSRALDAPVAAALARQLLAPNYGAGTMHLIYDADMPPLWRIVLERGWMAWIPLLLALAGWLWARRQRFGPLLPSPQPARRSLLEHVRASGEHLHRHGRGHLLHGALRELFEARLRRRDPYAASLEGEAQQQAIAARTGVDQAEVAAALRAPVPFVAADLRLRISKLNRLRLRL